MEGDCFPALCWFLPAAAESALGRRESRPPEPPPTRSPSDPSRLSGALVWAPGSRSKCPLASPAHTGVRVPTLPSHLVPPAPSPTGSPSLFPVSLSPLLPCRLEHQHHLSQFLIYVLINDVCFSLSDFLHSDFPDSRFILIGVFVKHS